MIQRIQSLYLLLTSLLSLLFLSGRFLRFFNDSFSEIVLNYNGIWQSAPDGGRELLHGQITLTTVMILIILISLIAIFLYKNRKLQIKLAAALIFLSVASIALTVFYALIVTSKYHEDMNVTFRMFLPLFILLFSIMAYRGVKKDEDIIKSYDRLR